MRFCVGIGIVKLFLRKMIWKLLQELCQEEVPIPFGFWGVRMRLNCRRIDLAFPDLRHDSDGILPSLRPEPEHANCR